MLEPLLGTLNRERVLLFLLARGEGYPRQVARCFSTDLGPIQNQFANLERGGVIRSRQVGRTRLYQFDPGYAFLDALKTLLTQALSAYPREEQERLRAQPVAGTGTTTIEHSWRKPFGL